MKDGPKLLDDVGGIHNGLVLLGLDWVGWQLQLMSVGRNYRVHYLQAVNSCVYSQCRFPALTEMKAS